MAINRVSANPEPTNEPAKRLMHSRYIKTHHLIAPELEEKIAPKYGTAREMDRRDQVWLTRRRTRGGGVGPSDASRAPVALGGHDAAGRRS